MIFAYLFFFYLFCIFLAAIFFSIYNLISLRDEKEKVFDHNYTPRALVMIPCKGFDIELKKNIESIANQKYSNYEVIAIIESKKDLAYKSIKAARINYIISNKKFNRGSRKVMSLSSAIEKFKDYEIYVTADSDIQVNENWLENLILPLKDKKNGISTTFPIFEPIGGFWSKTKCIWGLVGMGLMKSNKTRFGWGGSLAFKKEIMKDEDFEYFSRSISDDIAITKICERKKLKIAYSKDATPIVKCDDDFKRFFEWSTRQTAFSILGNRRNLYVGITVYSFEIIVLISGIILGFFLNLIYFILLTPFLLRILTNYYKLKKYYIEFALITFISPFIYLFNLIIASKMKEIEWRGHKYKLRL